MAGPSPTAIPVPEENGATGRAGLVDSHCHLVLLEDRGLLEEALEKAALAGVEQIVSVGLNLVDSERNREMAEGHAGVFFSVGWHPHERAAPGPAELSALNELLAHPRAVAVGEIGLDRHWRRGHHETPIDVQLRSMRAMVELAAEHRKPLIVHDREAHDEVMAELERVPETTALMHCFSGDAELAARCGRAGHLVSFSGTVTYPGNEGLREAVRRVAPDSFLVETDAPFLPPQPYRGRPNQPAYMADTAAAVAALRRLPVEAVRRQTSAAARRLFGLPEDDLLARPGA